MSVLIAHNYLPGDTPVLCDQYGTVHRHTQRGPACGWQGETKRSTVTAAYGFNLPACTSPKCWGGERPW